MIIARIGTLELSVYNLILQLIAVIQMPMFGYSTAALSLISESYGRKDYDKKDVISLAQFCLPAALLIQLFNYGMNIEKSALQSIGDSKYTLYTTFVIHVIVLWVCAFFAKKLFDLYVLLGTGYGIIFFVLSFRARIHDDSLPSFLQFFI